eukprot:3860738-Karenia_brevis.AAC.1
MYQSLSEGNEKAQLTISSEVHVHRSEATAFTAKCGTWNSTDTTDSTQAEGASRDDQMKDA